MSDAKFTPDAAERTATFPGRERFIRDNAASLLRERDTLIQRQREEVKRLIGRGYGLKAALDRHHVDQPKGTTCEVCGNRKGKAYE